MAKAKKDKKVVVNQAYYELVVRKAELLDSMSSFGDGIEVNAGNLKDLAKIQSDWDKVDAGRFEGTAKPFGE